VWVEPPQISSERQLPEIVPAFATENTTPQKGLRGATYRAELSTADWRSDLL
jgi:hypothetical protein